MISLLDETQEKVFWFANEAYLGETRGGGLKWTPPVGTTRVLALTPQGQSASSTIHAK